MQKTLIALAVTCALLFAAAPVQAHAHATVVEANGNRCYIVTDTFDAEVEYWIETNGLLEGGEPMGPPPEEAGLPVSGVPFWDALEVVFNALGVDPGDIHPWLEDGDSGLQRGPVVHNGVTYPADTQVSEDEWVLHCLL